MNTSTPLEPASPDSPPRSLALPTVVSLFLSAANFALAGWAWSRLPEGARVPSHWNFSGQVDAYGSRATVFLAPVIMVGITLLFLAIPRFDPRQAHLLRSSRAYAAIWLALAAFITGLNVVIVRTALGHPVAMEKWMVGALGVFCIVIGNYFGKIRSNFFVGIRTPWTLSSELSWNKTHRVGGWVFAAFGLFLVAAVTAQLPSRAVFVFIVVSLPLMAISLAAYSYFIWRDDPNRVDRSSLN